MLTHMMSREARAVAVFAATAVVFLAGACSDGTTASNTLADKSAPSVTLSAGTSSVDTVISFQVDAKDNLGLKTISVKVSGGLSLSFDTTFTSANTDVAIPFNVSVNRSIPRGTPVVVTASAVDGALNRSAVDTLRLTVGNVPPADVHFTSPASGTVAVVGKSIIVSVSARSAVKVRSVGFRATGALPIVDSTVYSSPLSDSVSVLDTIPIPASAPVGPVSLAPFVIDSLGQRTVGPAIILNVQPLSSINSTPVVNFSHTQRIEVGDTLHVEATDQTGITVLGYEVRRTVGGAIDVKDSITSNGNITSQLKTFLLRLPYSEFPTTVYVQAFARNSNNTRAYAKISGGTDRVDTITVVAGSTRSLPLGGSVADALYHPRTDRLYFTNIERNELEVFSLSDSSFKSPILVGSRPWGISAWPRDHNGTMGDTLLVANSGGTDISYVNLNGGGSGREVFRYALPNIVAFSVTSTKSPAGFTLQQRTKYDFSDRPQFLGSTCTGSGSSCGDVVVTYSTTPTPGQRSPFSKKNGTLRWENLTRRHIASLLRAGGRSIAGPCRHSGSDSLRRQQRRSDDARAIQANPHRRHEDPGVLGGDKASRSRFPRHHVRPQLGQLPSRGVRRRRTGEWDESNDIRCVSRVRDHGDTGGRNRHHTSAAGDRSRSLSVSGRYRLRRQQLCQGPGSSHELRRLVDWSARRLYVPLEPGAQAAGNSRHDNQQCRSGFPSAQQRSEFVPAVEPSDIRGVGRAGDRDLRQLLLQESEQRSNP